MSRKVICCLLIAVACLCSCKKRGHVIPRGKMAKIYAEMFVADQELAGQPQKVRSSADTSWVYEPIFEKYGYTSDDYRASVAYYIQDANRFARILRQTASIIEGDVRALKKQKARMELLENAGMEEGRFAPEKVFYMTGIGNPDTFGADTLRFYVDSTGGSLYFDAREWADTAFYGPEMVFKGDTVAVADSLDADTALEGVATHDKGFKAGTQAVSGQTRMHSGSAHGESAARQAAIAAPAAAAVLPSDESAVGQPEDANPTGRSGRAGKNKKNKRNSE